MKNFNGTKLVNTKRYQHSIHISVANFKLNSNKNRLSSWKVLWRLKMMIIHRWIAHKYVWIFLFTYSDADFRGVIFASEYFEEHKRGPKLGEKTFLIFVSNLMIIRKIERVNLLKQLFMGERNRPKLPRQNVCLLLCFKDQIGQTKCALTAIFREHMFNLITNELHPKKKSFKTPIN